jgi:hypothetical protein
MADVSTEVAIATQTLGSAASSITFNSIPATYTDLRVVLVATGGGTLTKRLQFNSDTAPSNTNYSHTQLGGTGSATYSNGENSVFAIRFASNQIGDSSTIPVFSSIDIFSYAGSTYKTVLATTSSDQNGAGYVQRTVGLWRSTAAISSVVLMIDGDTYATGTTATLYGIL